MDVEDVSFDFCRVPKAILRPGAGEAYFAYPSPVKIEPFWLASTPVTNIDYERFDPDHRRSPYSDEDLAPVTEVSWIEAQEYASWLSEQIGFELRLPEALEWELACLGGTKGPYPSGAGYLREMGRIRAQEAGPVGRYPANGFGHHDMVGNVHEWTDQWMVTENGLDLLPGDPGYEELPKRARVIKNCAATNLSLVFCECYKYHLSLPPRSRGDSLGFRLAADDVTPSSTQGRDRKAHLRP